MPVSGHQAVSTNADGCALEGLDQHTLKGRVIGVVPEQFHFSGRAIQHMIDDITGSVSGLPRHGVNNNLKAGRKKRDGSNYAPFQYWTCPVFCGRPVFCGQFVMFGSLRNWCICSISCGTANASICPDISSSSQQQSVRTKSDRRRLAAYWKQQRKYRQLWPRPL